MQFQKTGGEPTQRSDRLGQTVLVSGCFDLLHSGHVAFLEAAAELGELVVAVGSDHTVHGLKGRYPENSEEERLYMIRSLRCVKWAFISPGSGHLHFSDEMEEIRPDFLVTNEDGHTAEKEELCRALGTEYVVLKREPHSGLPQRSTTAARTQCRIPYRIDLAGGWLDQPFVSRYSSGPVVVASIEPDDEFPERSGMATSTRNTARWLWGSRLPPRDPVESARMLFACENPPGKEEIAGSQDALGLALPGISRLQYDGGYWPEQIDRLSDDDAISWLESLVWLLPLEPRPQSFRVIEQTNISADGARRLAEAADACWHAILARNATSLGAAVRDGFRAQVAMFPAMASPRIERAIAGLPDHTHGYKLTGAGGGGYLLAISQREISEALRIRIHRSEGSTQ